MTITRWDPFADLSTLRQSMDRLFDDYFMPRSTRTMPTIWQPAVEVSETDNEIIVKAELPGVDPKNVQVTVTGQGLMIKGEAQAEQEEKGKNYYRRELRYGMFHRTIPLPAEVKSDETKATFRNGILEVRVPKAEHAKPKTVKVETQPSSGDGRTT